MCVCVSVCERERVCVCVRCVHVLGGNEWHIFKIIHKPTKFSWKCLGMWVSPFSGGCCVHSPVQVCLCEDGGKRGKVAIRGMIFSGAIVG